MDFKKRKGIIESILFAAGREVELKELVSALEIEPEEVINIIENMKIDYECESRGIEILNVNNSYQFCSKKDNYNYLYDLFDKRAKANLSPATLETLSIIAYNKKITRAEIESIRGVNSDGTLYKLLDYGLIEESGKSDAPGKPMTYSTSSEFLKMFGLTNISELPELPRYKLDDNRQIVIDELLEEVENLDSQTNNNLDVLSTIDDDNI